MPTPLNSGVLGSMAARTLTSRQDPKASDLRVCAALSGHCSQLSSKPALKSRVSFLAASWLS